MMLADRILRYADIQACCACLGFREGSVYKVDADAEASIRSLLRYLRNEGSDCDVRLELGRLKIVSSDLIPLLRSCGENKTLTELVIRLLMNLTQPALVCFRQEVPKDRDLYGTYARLDDLLKSYKKDFADEELFRVLCKLVGDLLDRKWEDRSEEDRLLIERILILVRNVLHIAPDTMEERLVDDVSVHDQLLWAMHLSGWDELLLFLGNAEDEHMFAFHTLEIISLMLREQTPELLASAGNSVQQITQMDELIERQRTIEISERRKFLFDRGSRQDRFGGTFELLNTMSLSDRPLIYHHDVSKPAMMDRDSSEVNTEQQLGLVDLDRDKKTFRKPRNRKPLIDRPLHRRSILAIQLYLQRFCWNFLQFCYNPLMRTAKASLTRHAAQENDETYYLWAMRFFLAFCRFYKFRSSLLSETLSVSTFHWIYDQVMHYREVLFSDRRGGGTNRNAVQASRRLELAVLAYREFLTCLHRMVRVTDADRVPDPELGETSETVEEQLRIQSNAAENIMANVFYVSEYQEVYPILLRDFNEAVQSREYLRNLIESAHLFISLLADRMKSTQTIFVRRKKVVRRRRGARQSASAAAAKSKHKRKQEAEEDEESSELRQLRIEYQWTHQLLPELINILENPSDANAQQGDEEDDEEEASRLFDAISGGSEAKQLRSAIRRVQAALFAGRAVTALRLSRRMWRLWPEVAPITVDDENDPILNDERVARLAPTSVSILSALRQIHLTELQDSEDEDEQNEGDEATGEEDENEYVDDLYNEEMGLEGSDSENVLMTTEKEVQMDLSSFLLKFAHPKIVHALTLCLADYSTNPRTTNTALVRVIHRLAVRQKLVGSFFQLRLFHVFQQFLHDDALVKSNEFRDLVNLIKYILRKFFAALQKNNALAIEVLFYKSIREGFEVAQGYGTFEDTKKSSKWNPELDEELIKLFESYRNDPVPPGRDLVDVMLHHFSDQTKTRRQIISRLIFLDIITSAKQVKQLTVREDRPRRRGQNIRAKNEDDNVEWTEDEYNRLCSAVDENRGSKTLLTNIMDSLSVDRDLAVRRKQELAELEDPEAAAAIVIPPLRSRRYIAAKLLEFNLVNDRAELGRNPRKRNRATPARHGALNIDLDATGSIGRPVTKRRRKRRKDSSSDEELLFPDDDPDLDMARNSDDDYEDDNFNVHQDNSASSSSDKESATSTGLASLGNADFPPRHQVHLSDSDSDSEAERPLRIVADVLDSPSPLEKVQEKIPRPRNYPEDHTEGDEVPLNVSSRKRRVVLSSDSED